jgi:hypothetical protein
MMKEYVGTHISLRFDFIYYFIFATIMMHLLLYFVNYFKKIIQIGKYVTKIKWQRIRDHNEKTAAAN